MTPIEMAILLGAVGIVLLVAELMLPTHGLLGVIGCLAILAGILLLRRTAWGYLLASVAVLKGLTMALAVSAMGLNMILAGVPDSPAILIPFLILTGLNLVMAVLLLRNIQTRPAGASSAGDSQFLNELSRAP